MKKKYFTVFICICSLLIIARGQRVHEPVKTDTKDEWGNMLNAHGAGILEYAGTYYLFGEIKKGNTWLVPGQGWEDYRVPAGGISCYSSKDLVHWKYHGIVLAPVIAVPENDLDTSRVLERPKVIYNDRRLSRRELMASMNNNLCLRSILSIRSSSMRTK